MFGSPAYVWIDYSYKDLWGGNGLCYQERQALQQDTGTPGVMKTLSQQSEFLLKIFNIMFLIWDNPENQLGDLQTAEYHNVWVCFYNWGNAK